MTLRFQSYGSTVVDSQYGIEIYVPRIVPGDGPGQIEYQFHLMIQGKSDGIGVFGVSTLKKIGDTQERIASLLLSPDQVVNKLLDVKQRIAYPDDTYTFLAEFTRGMLLVFEGESSLYTNYRYTVLVDENALTRLDVKVPATAERNSEGSVVLAQLYVPCRGDANTEA